MPSARYKPWIAAVVVAGALTAPTATASPVEVESRATGTMCNETQCVMWWQSTAYLVFHSFFGEADYDCDVEMELVFNAGGGVTVVPDVLISDGTSTTCDESLVVCEQSWTGAVTHTGSAEQLDLEACIDPPIITACEGTVHIPLTRTGNDYSAVVIDSEVEGDPNCEFTVSATFEDPDGIEIHHL